MFGEFDGLVEQWLVLDDLGALDAAGRRHHDLRLGVVDSHGELTGGEAPEHDGVDGAEPGAGEHRHHRLRDHRHVDDDAIALGDAASCQHPCESGNLIAKLLVGVRPDGAGYRAVVDERGLVTSASVDVAIEGVVRGVELAADEPPALGAGRTIEHVVPLPVPIDHRCRFAPEGFGIV